MTFSDVAFSSLFPVDVSETTFSSSTKRSHWDKSHEALLVRTTWVVCVSVIILCYSIVIITTTVIIIFIYHHHYHHRHYCESCFINATSSNAYVKQTTRTWKSPESYFSHFTWLIYVWHSWHVTICSFWVNRSWRYLISISRETILLCTRSTVSYVFPYNCLICLEIQLSTTNWIILDYK